MSDSDAERIHHILDAIHRIDQTVALGQSAFDEDVDRQDAVLHRLQVIGEASGKLSREFRDHHPSIPWQRIIDLRNILVHDYDRIDVTRIWNIAVTRIPELRAMLEHVGDDLN